MHVHQSVWKEGKNLFQGNGYSGLSDFALYYIGGIIKHAKALNAITNPGTNSYKRLVPGFEAPINLAYFVAQPLRRLPHPARHQTPRRAGWKCGFPDPTSQFLPRVCSDADGRTGRMQNKIHPGDPIDKNMYDLPPAQAKRSSRCARRSEMALECLNKDREFLTRGGCSPTTCLTPTAP